MPWIIDTDLLIEGERANPKFLAWLQGADAVATTDIVRAEFLLGVHAVSDTQLRERGVRFYADCISRIPSLPSESPDYQKAAELAGQARRANKGSPGLIDGLVAALAIRHGATVATRNTKDFAAMGCPCLNPLIS